MEISTVYSTSIALVKSSFTVIPPPTHIVNNAALFASRCASDVRRRWQVMLAMLRHRGRLSDVCCSIELWCTAALWFFLLCTVCSTTLNTTPHTLYSVGEVNDVWCHTGARTGHVVWLNCWTSNIHTSRWISPSCCFFSHLFSTC